MKLNHRIIAMTLAAGLGTFAFQAGQAGNRIETGKGVRLDTSIPAAKVQGKDLRTVEDFRSLRKGDKIASYCRMMKATTFTTVRNVDSKGHLQLTETRDGLKMEGCNIVLQRKGGHREVNSVMVCPNGTLTPVQCRKI